MHVFEWTAAERFEGIVAHMLEYDGNCFKKTANWLGRSIFTQPSMVARRP
jgi:hypothetical protein